MTATSNPNKMAASLNKKAFQDRSRKPYKGNQLRKREKQLNTILPSQNRLQATNIGVINTQINPITKGIQATQLKYHSTPEL
jgi:hypothetical protein